MMVSRCFGTRVAALFAAAAMIGCLGLSACSTDEVAENQGERSEDCPPGEEMNPITEECEPKDDGGEDTGTDADDAGTDPDPDDTGPNPDDTGPDPDPGDTGADDTGTDDTGPGPDPEPCEGLQCETADCPAGQETTISGTVHIPSGDLPLPEVTVYVPNSELEPVEEGASCEPCEDELSADVAMGDRTDVDGTFVIDDAPVGEEIPLVIEIGKWRRTHTIEVDECQDNPLDDDMTRLPRNPDEGNMPRIAVTTGNCDALECFMRKVGIDDSQITTDRDDDGDGVVHLYVGEDAPEDDDGNQEGGTDRFTDDFNDGLEFTKAQQLWNDADKLRDYDIMLSSCECTPNTRSSTAYDAFQEFVDVGGRAFLSHYHYTWLSDGTSDLQSVGTLGQGFGLPPGGGFGDSATGTINTTFPKGEVLADWMFGIGGTTYGQFEIHEVRGSVDSIDESIVQDWVTVDDDAIQYFSFNTPVGVAEDNQCGRVVFSDIHVAGQELDFSFPPEEIERDQSSPEYPFPEGCKTDEFTEQEQALVFMLFDLSSCIIPDDKKKDVPGP